MTRMHAGWINLCAILLFSWCGGALASEIEGVVRNASGDKATIAVNGDVLPKVGDKVDIFFKLSGVEVSVGSGKVTGVSAANIQVKMDHATGTVSKDQRARFHSSPVRAAKSPAPSPTPSPAAPKTNASKPPNQNKTAPSVPLTTAKDIETAIAVNSKAIAADPKNASAYFARALAYFAKRNYDAVILDCSKAIPLVPKNLAEFFCLRGTAYAARKDFVRALADHNRAIQLKPDFAVAYKRRGIDKEHLNDSTGAIADWQKAIALSPAYQGELGPNIKRLKSTPTPKPSP